MNANKLWFTRVKEYWSQASRYIQYMLNSLLYTIIITLLIAAFYYAQWLNTLSPTFPIPFVLALIVAVALTSGKVRTFIKEADLVFLLPYQEKLNVYFRYSIIYSTLFHFAYLGLLLMALGPLYYRYDQADEITFTYGIVLILFLKVWNIISKWYISFTNERSYFLSDTVVRFTINFLFVYFIFVEASIYYLISMMVIIMLLFFFYKKKISTHQLKWDYLLKTEQESIYSFYRFANLFTDVPNLKSKVKPRHGWSKVLALLPTGQKHTFSYLYWRAFLRSGDYFGMYVRLFFVGTALLLFIPNELAKIAVFLLIIYLSSFQLLTLWKHIDLKLWISLYPISTEERKHSFRKVHRTLLFVKAVLLTVVMIIGMTNIFYVFIAFSLSVLFINYYSQLAMRKKV
jgi:ABC-2 type transport system permease protein